MAAVTTVITAVAGLGLSAYKMYEANEDQKDADAAAKQAANKIRNIEETNAFDALQAPDVSRLAYEQNAANTAGNVEALRGMGAEGAAQIAKVEQVAKENNLKTAESQAKINYQRDFGAATNAAGIEKRRAEREGTLEMEMVQGAGNLATGIGDATSLEAQAQRADGGSEFQTVDGLGGGSGDGLTGMSTGPSKPAKVDQAYWDGLSLEDKLQIEADNNN
jgi:hypothetical protein